MASDINRVTVTGRLTRDAELRQTQGGTAILAFGIAVNDRRKNNQTGEWEDVPSFVDCVLFGNRAQSIAQYLVKATKVAVEGKLRWSQWEDKSGQKRSKLEVVVDELVLMGGGQRQQMAPQAPQMPQNAPQAQQRYSAPPQQQMAPQMAPQMPQNGYQQPMPQQQMPQAPQPDMFDMDIPF